MWNYKQCFQWTQWLSYLLAGLSVVMFWLSVQDTFSISTNNAYTQEEITGSYG